MNPNDFASVFMLTAGAMLAIGTVSGFVLGLFWRWFAEKPAKKTKEVIRPR